MTQEPRILPAWRKLLLRLQSTTRNHDGGMAVIQMIVVVKDGQPLWWAEPKIVKLEPKLTINMEMLRSELSDENLAELLQIMVN